MEDHRAAFEDLLRRYLPALRRLAWSYAPGEVEDLVQEIALQLWTALPRFRGDSSERTWVYRVAHNTAITFITRQNRRDKREGGELPVDVPTNAATPESSAMDEQRRQRLRVAVAELPLNDRQVIVLYLEGLTAVEIESVTGMSAGSIATRLTRVRQKLMGMLR